VGHTASDGTTDVLVLRYNSNGTLDNTFGTKELLHMVQQMCLIVAMR